MGKSTKNQLSTHQKHKNKFVENLKEGINLDLVIALDQGTTDLENHVVLEKEIALDQVRIDPVIALETKIVEV